MKDALELLKDWQVFAKELRDRIEKLESENKMLRELLREKEVTDAIKKGKVQSRCI